MAVVFRGLKDASGSIDYQGNHNYTRVYRLHGNLDTDGEPAIIAAMAAQGISTFQPHPYDLNAKVTKVSVAIVARFEKGDDKGIIWEATVEYGPIPTNVRPGGPLAQPPTWRLEAIPVLLPAFVDKNGDPILNTAGDPFDPPLERPKTNRRLTVTRNEVAPNFAAIQEVENKTNDAPWLLWDTGQVVALPIEIPERLYDQEAQQRYYPMRYSFDIDLDGWKKEVVNSGFNGLDSSGNSVRLFDKAGQELTEPAFLDDAGHQLAHPITAANIVILEFELLDSTYFGIFNLDNLDGLS